MFQVTNTTSPELIHSELLEIQEYLEASYPSDNPAACTERLIKLGEYMARSGKLKSDAEWHYNNVIGSSIMTALKDAHSDKMSTTTLNKYIESMSKDYKQLLTFADRVNRSCVHQMEGLRTLISYIKSQMQL